MPRKVIGTQTFSKESQPADEVKPLEDETYTVASQQRPLVRPQAGNVLAEEHPQRPSVGGEDAAENGEKRGLAAALMARPETLTIHRD